jgi:FKBP-type peptidyl-prolyl cis-trans isomerase
MDVSMKNFPLKLLLAFAICALFLLACKKEEASDSIDKETSYAFGMLMANQLTGQMQLTKLHFDYEAFKQGFMDYNEAKETRLTQEMAMEKINTLIMKLQSEGDEKRWLEGEKNREEGEEYMALNKVRGSVNTTASGLQYEVLTEGSGEKPGPEAVVQVHYEGTFINGIVFDSSYTRGVPTEFPLSGVIRGWTEGLQLMNVGSTYRFVIPPDLAYGPSGTGSIPPNSTLVFKVELLSIIE